MRNEALGVPLSEEEFWEGLMELYPEKERQDWCECTVRYCPLHDHLHEEV